MIKKSKFIKNEQPRKKGQETKVNKDINCVGHIKDQYNDINIDILLYNDNTVSFNAAIILILLTLYLLLFS